MKKILYNTLISCIGITIMISCSLLEEESSSSSSFTEDISFDPSSVPDNATTVVFGQTYQYQVGYSSNYSGTFTFSLSNEPDNMTISSTGLIEWTPTKASEITTHSNITITLTTASGYVLTQTYDLTVTGTCTSGNVLAIWSGDQRTSIDSSKFLGNITSYTDNGSDICGQNENISCTAVNNYALHHASVDLIWGPVATVNDGAMFFYNQYDNTTHSYLFYFFGMEEDGEANKVGIDAFVYNNASQDSVLVSDDSGETVRRSQSQSGTTGLYTSSYTGRYGYGSNSDGAVIGPFSNTDNQTLLDNGTTFKVFVDFSGTSSLNTSTYHGITTGLQLGDLDSMKYYSKDNSTVSLGSEDNFTIGYKTRITCE